MPRSLTRTHSPIRAINALIDAHACKRSGGRRAGILVASIDRHRQRRSNTDAVSHAKRSRGNTESKLREPRGTRFTDPSCERRYRYLHRSISAERLIGSAREYLGPAVGPREKARGAYPPATVLAAIRRQLGRRLKLAKQG